MSIHLLDLAERNQVQKLENIGKHLGGQEELTTPQGPMNLAEAEQVCCPFSAQPLLLPVRPASLLCCSLGPSL